MAGQKITIQSVLGQCIKALRKQGDFTLEGLSAKCGITYQYLSGIENGKENFTIDVLENVANALGIHPKTLVVLAYQSAVDGAPVLNPKHFRNVPLPRGLVANHIELACNQTSAIIHRINQNLIAEVNKPLQDYIQGNNFSGLVSNILSDALNDHSPYKHNHAQRYPDLMNKADNVGLEVKATINIGKGGESHNGHSGWHLIACFEGQQNGDINFLHLMFADLIGHNSLNSDWKYLKSVVNEETGSQRTETYSTNAKGTTKLRHGSLYLVPEKISFKRWRIDRTDPVPPHSIFYQ